MDPVLQALLAIIGGFLAGSGGFWVYLRHRYEHKDHVERLIMGLAHDKIMSLGVQYIEQGYVGEEAYQDLFEYFWEPYVALGGNSSAERIIMLVQTLPLRPERREFPEERNLADRVEKGSESVLQKIEEGDTNFERNRKPKYNS